MLVFRSFRILSGALVLVFAAAPSFAGVVGNLRHPSAAAAPEQQRPQPRRGSRSIRPLLAEPSITIFGPPGCTNAGSGNFVGGGQNNYAGGFESGILSGAYNGACDDYSSVVAGFDNILGGDNLAPGSAIVNGYYNSIEASGESFIGAGYNNTIGKAAPYNGALQSAIISGNNNILAAPYSFIGTGVSNTIIAPSSTVTNGPASFIGSGYNNAVEANWATIVGGASNLASGDYAAIVGGFYNTASGKNSFVGSGNGNSVGALAAFIGSGQANRITQNGGTGGPSGAAYSAITSGFGNLIAPLVNNGARYGVIGGGHGNTLSSFNGVIAGGQFNTARGDYAVVPGGLYNSAIGIASFAAGNGSQALTNGAFVWSDDVSGATPLKSTGSNQFLARASGGVAFYSSPALRSGVLLRPGAGSWSSLSDRASKTNIVALNPTDVLAKVERLPVSEWSYRTEDASIRHVGPMAQDFYAAFSIGEDDRHITSIDEDGVALAAIKGLGAKNASLENKVRQMEARDADLTQRAAKLETEVAALLARAQ